MRAGFSREKDATALMTRHEMYARDRILKSCRGGARIDAYNATWPFANPRLQQKTLTLKVLFGGKFVFDRAQIDSPVTYHGILPIIGKAANGIEFLHNVANYPKRIIFWHFGNIDEPASFHPDTPLLRNLCVDLRNYLCDVLKYVSAQFLDLLDLSQNWQFPNWKQSFVNILR